MQRWHGELVVAFHLCTRRRCGCGDCIGEEQHKHHPQYPNVYESLPLHRLRPDVCFTNNAAARERQATTTQPNKTASPLPPSLSLSRTHKHAQTHKNTHMRICIVPAHACSHTVRGKKLLLLFMLTCVPDDAARLFIIRSLFF